MKDVKTGSHTLDGNPHVQTAPYPERRVSTYPMPFAREENGGLTDDPTESGAPVRDRIPFAGLKGGR
jgi:hypothetical protein